MPRGGLLAADPYAVLGVTPDADVGEIKRAYRRLARQWHPDRNPAPEAEARFVEIAAAHDQLIDPRKRALHDHAARGAERGPGAVPMTFLQDFTDAVERAERLVLEWTLARYLRDHRRGRGVEAVARFAADLVDGTALAVDEDPGRWARFRARRRLAGLEVDIDYHRAAPPSRVEGRRGHWRISLAPASFWMGGVRESSDLDQAVAQHVAGQLVVVLAVEAGARWLLLRGRPGEAMVRRAREMDDAWLQRTRRRVLWWGALAVLSAAMLWAGYQSGR